MTGTKTSHICSSLNLNPKAYISLIYKKTAFKLFDYGVTIAKNLSKFASGFGWNSGALNFISLRCRPVNK